LNFIFGIVCLFVCVYAFSLRRESPDMILGDKPLISEVVLSQLTGPSPACQAHDQAFGRLRPMGAASARMARGHNAWSRPEPHRGELAAG
jgi:hypothetical protein